MSACVICNHEHREEIEYALFKMTPETADDILYKLSEVYHVSFEALQEHSLFHTSFNGDSDEDSIVRQIKMKEADILAAVALDQLNTVKAVGKRIRRFTSTENGEDVRFEKSLTKAVVDLYVGASDGLRKNVQTIADINQLLNGPKDDGISGLATLARVLDESKKLKGSGVND